MRTTKIEIREIEWNGRECVIYEMLFLFFVALRNIPMKLAIYRETMHV